MKYEKPKIRVETNDCIEVIDNSMVFESTNKLVKEIKEYALVSEQPVSLETIVVSEQEHIETGQIGQVDSGTFVVTEYVQLEKIEKEGIEQKPSDKTEQVVQDQNELLQTESEYKIEDVTNLEIGEGVEVKTEPVISLFKEEKIIKINVENDEVIISEIKDEFDDLMEEEKNMQMKVDTSETEKGIVGGYLKCI